MFHFKLGLIFVSSTGTNARKYIKIRETFEHRQLWVLKKPRTKRKWRKVLEKVQSAKFNNVTRQKYYLLDRDKAIPTR